VPAFIILGPSFQRFNWLCRKKLTTSSYSATKFEKELLEEQMNLLDHMEIEPGIAKNQALRENVFVTLTCILQKIPLFVVGKPGSGKTLSLQLIFRCAEHSFLR
jgi:MoxR-like ATPase